VDIYVYYCVIQDHVHHVQNKSMFVVIVIKQLQQHVVAVLKVGHVEKFVRNYYLVNSIDVNRYYLYWLNRNNVGIQVCHVGECLPCQKTSIRACQCGKTKAVRNCNELIFQCDQVKNNCSNFVSIYDLVLAMQSTIKLSDSSLSTCMS